MDEEELRSALDDEGVLDLADRELVDDSIEGWDRFGWLKRVRVLELSRNELTDLGLARLARCEGLVELEELDLWQNDLGEGCGAILARARLPRLRRLALGMNPVGDAALVALADASALPGIEVLGLAHTGAGEEAVRRFFASCRRGSLRQLDLRGAPVGRAAASALAAATGLQALEVLDVSDNALGPDALGDTEVEALLRSPGLPALRTLVLLPPRIWGSAGEVDVVSARRQLAETDPRA